MFPSHLSRLLIIFILFLDLSAHANLSGGWSQNLTIDFPAAPSGSWEEWIQKIHQGEKISSRPDEKNMLLPLPLWVDCHLTWLFESRLGKNSQAKLPELVVLQSSPQQCSGQMERWASRKSLKKLQSKAEKKSP